MIYLDAIEIHVSGGRVCAKAVTFDSDTKKAGVLWSSGESATPECYLWDIERPRERRQIEQIWARLRKHRKPIAQRASQLHETLQALAAEASAKAAKD